VLQSAEKGFLLRREARHTKSYSSSALWAQTGAVGTGLAPVRVPTGFSVLALKREYATTISVHYLYGIDTQSFGVH